MFYLSKYIARNGDKKMNNNKHSYYNMTGALGLAILLSACASKNPQLIQAEKNYQAASQDPDIQKYAPVKLYEAKKTLTRAKNVKSDNDPEINHLAYLTEKRVEIASEEAKEGQLQQEIKGLYDQRDKVLMSARENETIVANKRANEAESRATTAEDRANQLGQTSDELRQRLNELEAKETDRGLVMTLRDMLFDVNKADLKSGSSREINKVASVLTQYPNRDVLVEGYTDSSGMAGYNHELSQRRARAVESALLRQGIHSSRIMTQGYGESYPVTTNNTSVGRQQNRRVEITVLNEGKKAAQSLRSVNQTLENQE